MQHHDPVVLARWRSIAKALLAPHLERLQRKPTLRLSLPDSIPADERARIVAECTECLEQTRMEAEAAIGSVLLSALLSLRHYAELTAPRSR